MLLCQALRAIDNFDIPVRGYELLMFAHRRHSGSKDSPFPQRIVFAANIYYCCTSQIH